MQRDIFSSELLFREWQDMKLNILSNNGSTTKMKRQGSDGQSSMVGVEAAGWEKYMKEEHDPREYYRDQERIRSTGGSNSRKGWVPPPYNN